VFSWGGWYPESWHFSAAGGQGYRDVVAWRTLQSLAVVRLLAQALYFKGLELPGSELVGKSRPVLYVSDKFLQVEWSRADLTS
jgi:hypothetical protein